MRIIIYGPYDDADEKVKQLADKAGGKVQVAAICKTSEKLYEAVDTIVADAVVFAAKGADANMIDNAERISVNRPSVCLLAFTEAPTPAFYENTMQNGVHYAGEYPETGEAFLDILESRTGQLQAKLNTVRAMQTTVVTTSTVIGVYSPKAGTGCTFLSVNLAAALAKAGKRVLLMDMDLMFGDACAYLGITPKHTISDLCQDFDEYPINTLSAYFETAAGGFSVLAAPKAPEYAEMVHTDKVAKMVETAKKYFDYILMDLPSGMTETHTGLFPLTSRILFLVTDQIPVLMNTRKAMDVLDILQQGQKVSVIINRYDKRSAVRPVDIRKVLQKNIIAKIPNDYYMVSNSINVGSPCINGQQDKKEISTAIYRIAGLVLTKDMESDISEATDAEITKKDAELPLIGKQEAGQEKGQEGRNKPKAKGGHKLTLLLLSFVIVAAAAGGCYYLMFLR